jgi:hypothetical protein
MGKQLETLNNFAKTINNFLRSDRDNNVAVAGFTGEGKSCFLTSLFREYAKVSGVPWTYYNMTWSRKELITWIDGEGKDRDPETGLKKNQLPEFSGVLVDELFSLFYRRTWFETGQIDSIATLNMCRDRHLFIAGAIPNFWELDTGFTSRMRLYVYIPNRGIAWVFEQENNPFTIDKWNSQDNKKRFRKDKNPYSSPNFVCEIHFEDWSIEEKTLYYKIRNEKRLSAISENRGDKVERYARIKEQRDKLIRLYLKEHPKTPDRVVAEIIDMSREAIKVIREGL